MRAPLSIIVPTLDAAPALPGLFAALYEGVRAGLVREVIVSDGGSGDASGEIARQAGALWIEGPPGRGRQLARGAAAAGGEWLFFVHADSWPEPGWARVLAGHMQTRPERAACFRLAFRARGFGARRTAAWANFRTRAFALPYGDQGLALSRDLYERVGGFAELALMEDVAMARALGGRITLLPAIIATGAERYERAGWTRQGARNLWRLARFMAGADPERLRRGYGPAPSSVEKYPGERER